MKAKNGISLIVLVITIVVIIILAAAVILSLGKNNPINDSKVASLLNDKDNVQSAMVNAIGARLAKNAADGASDTVSLLQLETAIIGTEKYKSDAIEGLYKIADGGWTELGIKKPATGSAWYYSVNDGKVYVEIATPASYYTENTSAMSMILTSVEADND